VSIGAWIPFSDTDRYALCPVRMDAAVCAEIFKPCFRSGALPRCPVLALGTGDEERCGLIGYSVRSTSATLRRNFCTYGDSGESWLPWFILTFYAGNVR